MPEPLHTLVRLRTAMSLPRLLLLLAMILLLAGLLAARAAGADINAATVRSLLQDIGPWGPPALIAAITMLLLVPALPASILQIAAGLAYGPLGGLCFALIADLLGASIGFLIARRWGRQAIVQRMTPDQHATFERLIQRMSWRSVMLLRLLPGPAYPIVSFAAGCSAISFRRYTLASLAGAAPSLALLAYAGDLVLAAPLLAFALVALLIVGLALVARLLKI
ncbi:MAG TPA: VTT domain-containing protein [Roseiflexaceae bacterium]|nr:VTT domain-containing protein [Roseiflexaceae bacterium]HMP39549.1 VTT domain-containing protein [Roseiflexaceae bacterium]